MPLNEALAAAFEDEVVILDVGQGSLLLLDAWAAQIWRSCDGFSTEAIVTSSKGEAKRVRETLQALTDAGLIRQVSDEWIRGPVEWV
jgi:coenzyme PQQ synthesis protein D (PqqD)